VTPTPHDAFVRAILGTPEHAAAEFRAVLPEAIWNELDISSLQPLPGSFVDEKLRERHADLLFSCQTRSGNEALLYLLLEHQSSQDVTMPLRLLVYQTRVWEQWWQEHPEAIHLPPIVPIVLHHGPRAWSGSMRFSGLFESNLVGVLGRRQVDFEFLLDDLATASDEDLRDRVASAAVRLSLLALKHSREGPDLERRMLGWIDLLLDALRAPQGDVVVTLIKRYILETSPFVSVEFLDGPLAARLCWKGKESVVTTGQQLIQQGREVGRQEGRVEQLLVLLRHRFGELPVGLQARVAGAGAQELDAWAIRLLDAKTIAEVFEE